MVNLMLPDVHCVIEISSAHETISVHTEVFTLQVSTPSRSVPCKRIICLYR